MEGFAGSDAKLMRTTAPPHGEEWLIDVHQWFVRWADRSSVITILAKTDPRPRHPGARALGVSSDLPLEAMYRFARGARINDGPDEVHRMLVVRERLDDPEHHVPWW